MATGFGEAVFAKIGASVVGSVLGGVWKQITGKDAAAVWDPAAGRAREYPWGDTFDKELCNSAESQLRRRTPIGSYPKGASAYGCEDMAGNVWEWTLGDGGGGVKMLRGASFDYEADDLCAVIRGRGGPESRDYDLGFRNLGEVIP